MKEKFVSKTDKIPTQTQLYDDVVSEIHQDQ